MKLPHLEGQTSLNVAWTDTATGEEHYREFSWDSGGLPWTTLLDSFVSFISEAYGNDIFTEVAIRRNPLRDKAGWRGEFFGRATDQEIELHQQLDLFDETDFGSYGGTSE